LAFSAIAVVRDGLLRLGVAWRFLMVDQMQMELEPAMDNKKRHCTAALNVQLSRNIKESGRFFFSLAGAGIFAKGR